MIVRLKGDISGTRDGRPWPSRGSTVALPDDEAAQLCANGMAVPVLAEDVETAVPDDDAETRSPLTTDAATALGRRRKS